MGIYGGIKMKRFKVFDRENNYLRSFSSYQQAMSYKIMCGRYDWKIK